MSLNLLKRKLKKGQCCDDGKNVTLMNFATNKRKCKGCKMALTDDSVSKVDSNFCRYCKRVKDVEEL